MDHLYQLRTGASIGLIAASIHDVPQGQGQTSLKLMMRGHDVPFQQHRGTLLLRSRGILV